MARGLILNDFAPIWLALWFLLASSGAAFSQAQSPLTNVIQALRLSGNELRTENTASFDLVVTYSDARQRLLYAQDESGGIFISPAEGQPFPPFGERIRVHGKVESGSNLPFVNQAIVRLQGMAPLPAPKTAILKALAEGKYDSQWVEATAQIRGYRRVEDRAELFLQTTNPTMRVLIKDPSDGRLDWAVLADATVSIRGVGGVDAVNGVIKGGMLHVQSANQVTLLKQGNSDLFAMPAVKIASIAAQARSNQRVRVRGIFESQTTEYRIKVKDATGEIEIESMNSITPRADDIVEASGYASTFGNATFLEMAQARLLGIAKRDGAQKPDLDNPALVPVITSASELRQLSHAEAERKYPVRLRGVLTYANTNRGDAFLFDGTECVYLYACQPTAAMRAPERIEVSGESAGGLYAPFVKFGSAFPLGSGSWPAPGRVSFSKFASGSMDAQWIEVEGVLRTARKSLDNWYITLASADGYIDATMPDEPGGPSPDAWIDATLRLRGNCGMPTPINPNKSPFIFVPGRRVATVLQPPPSNPFNQSPRSIASLRQFKPGERELHRIRIRGTVSWSDLDREFVLQDSTGGIRIQLAAAPAPRPGQGVDAAGFPAIYASQQSPALEEAMVRAVSGAMPPPALLPKSTTIRELEQGENANTLAVVEGCLVARVDQPSLRTYYLEVDGRSFTAQLGLPIDTPLSAEPAPLPGSRLRLTGVVRLLPDLKSAPDAIQILLRDTADVVVISSPSWWTWKHSLISLGALAALATAAGAWIATLRVKVAKQERLVQEKMKKELAMEAQLRQSQKMEAVGQLAGGIAHDFNNLLQVIQGNAHMGVIELGPDNPAAEALSEIRRASDRASALVRQLLTFSRNVPRRMERLETAQLLADLTRMLRHLIGAHIALEVRTQPGLAPISGDRGQIEQVLVNLCINARDAMPEGGRLSVEAKTCSPSECPLVLARLNKQFVCISVQDTGHGIPPEIRHRIFEPFFTTKEVGKGTGLGLSTAYAIVHDHEGTIDVTSEPGKGATFLVYLPAAASQAEPAPADSPETPAIEGRQETILVAEDEEKVCALVCRVLSRSGYRVISACDGVEAIALIEQHSKVLDLAILDIVMPRKSGGAVYREMRHRWPHIACLFASGYSFDALKQAEIPEDEVPLIPKPYDPKILIQTVRQILDKKALTTSRT